jgi:hypothetical protein
MPSGNSWITPFRLTGNQELQSKLLDYAVGVVPDFIGHEMKSFCEASNGAQRRKDSCKHWPTCGQAS